MREEEGPALSVFTSEEGRACPVGSESPKAAVEELPGHDRSWESRAGPPRLQ